MSRFASVAGLTAAVAVLLMSAPHGVVAQEWSHETSQDEMTDELRAFAKSPEVSATEPLEFPYRDVVAQLALGCDGEDEWVYLAFSEGPNLTGGNTEDGYDVFRLRVRWDDDVQTHRMIQEWGEPFVQFQSDETVIPLITSSETVLVELPWYGSGEVYFRFPLGGAADAIAAAREACRG